MAEIDMSEVPSPPTSSSELTPNEEVELLNYLGGSYPKPSEKTGIVDFFYKIFQAKDTTKASNLSEFELGAVRIFQRTANYANELDLDKVSDYITKMAEIVLATALSKEGFFVEKAVTTKKQLYTESKQTGGKKKGWRKKEE